MAHFLEKQGFKQQALAVSSDPEHRFELAIQLSDLKVGPNPFSFAENKQPNKTPVLSNISIKVKDHNSRNISLQTARELAAEANSEQKWKQLAELATSKSQFELAQECLHKANDYGGLLLLATSSGKK